jgi:hypothetical protein
MLLMARLRMVSTIIVISMRRLTIHVCWISITVVTRIVLGSLVHSWVHRRRHAAVHLHIVSRGKVRIWICSLLLPLDFFFVVVLSLFLDWVHSIMLICFTLIILFFLCG